MLFILLFQLLDFEFQGSYIVKQQQLHIKIKFSSKKTFSFLNKTRVRSWDVHLVLYSSLHWKLSLSFFFRHLSPEDRVLNLIIIGETVKIVCSLQKYALLECTPRVRKEMLFLDFHGWIISKSLVFKKKKKLGFSSYFRASGITFTFALQRHFSGQAEKNRSDRHKPSISTDFRRFFPSAPIESNAFLPVLIVSNRSQTLESWDRNN